MSYKILLMGEWKIAHRFCRMKTNTFNNAILKSLFYDFHYLEDVTLFENQIHTTKVLSLKLYFSLPKKEKEFNMKT